MLTRPTTSVYESNMRNGYSAKDVMTSETYLRNRVNTIEKNLGIMIKHLNEVKVWMDSSYNKEEEVDYEKATIVDVIRYRTKVQDLRERMLEAKIIEGKVLEVVQSKCAHKDKKWTRGGSHCYGHEDSELYCTVCEKTFF
jgi:hypothetical protein